MFWKYGQKYILIHWTKLVRLQFDAWYMHIISMHKFTRDFSISKQNKVRVFRSVIFLSTTFHNRGKKPVTNLDGSNEIVSMSIHSRNVETFPNCRKRKLSLFIHVCFFKENICKYQYDNWCFCSNQNDNPSSPTPKKLNTKHTGIINIILNKK